MATLVSRRAELPRTGTLVLDVSGWPGHVAGQHVDVRLVARDGYEARRSYSIASASEGTRVELTLEEVADGEVSPFLLNELRVGESFELRGPIGGHFTWEPGGGSPVLLVAGGSGVVPLMAMLRERQRRPDGAPAHLIYSARRLEDIIYRSELERMAAVDSTFELTYTLTRERPPGWLGEDRRIDRPMLERLVFPESTEPCAYICGPTELVERVASNLVTLGYQDSRIKTERFGPT